MILIDVGLTPRLLSPRRHRLESVKNACIVYVAKIRIEGPLLLTGLLGRLEKLKVWSGGKWIVRWCVDYWVVVAGKLVTLDCT